MLPPQLAHLIPQSPNYLLPDFKQQQLTPDACTKLADSVRTHTLLQLLKPVQIPQPDPFFIPKPTILVFCQPSEEIAIQNNNNVFPYAPVSYVEWVEAAGAKCVPIPYNTN